MKSLNNTINNICQYSFFKIYNSLNKIIFVIFKDMVFCVNWILGATILVSLFTFVLSKIEFILILGELLSRLISDIETFDRYK